MELSYWESRWRKNRIGWHMDRVYPPLVSYWDLLRLEKGAAVLVPLCGKSLDLLWLADQGYRVVGVEISDLAITQFFEETGIERRVETADGFSIYRSERIELFSGDFLKLDPARLPPIGAVYDKAALIALPPDQRRSYVMHLKQFCNSRTRILLNTFEYKEGEMTGPPFAVFREELEKLYGNRFELHLMHEESLLDRLPKFRRRGLKSYLAEKVYLMNPR